MRLGMVARMYVELIDTATQVDASVTKREAIASLIKDKGLQVLSGCPCDWRNPECFDELLWIRDEFGIEFEGGWGYDFVFADSDTALRSLDWLSEYIEKCCAPLGIKIIGTCAVTDRWLKEPPLEEALKRITEGLIPAAAICKKAGIRLAIENHADYRGKEIAKIIEDVNSTGLRARLDTGNPFWTYEDPIDAASALAPYTITTHVKEIKILKYGKNEGAILGQGHVDLDQIVKILAERSPEPDILPLIAEVEAIPEGTQISAYDASMEYLRTNFADYQQ